MKIYSHDYVQFLEEPLFGGTGRNTQRYEQMKLPWFDSQNTKMQGEDWAFDEIPLAKDAIEFRNNLTEACQFIITKSLQLNIFLDSYNGRSPYLILGQITTLPELEAFILTWTHFECNKHSRTYTENIRAYYPNPTQVFDEAMEDDNIVKLAKSITEPGETAYKAVIEHIYKNLNCIPITEEDYTKLYSALIMYIVETNILEGIRFYPNFAANWGISESLGLMNGNTDNLKLICKDENLHLAGTQMLLKLIKKDDGLLGSVYATLQRDIYNRYLEAYEETLEWSDYLFSNGSYLGMNSNILKEYINHITIRRMIAIGMHPNKEDLGGKYIQENPIPWVNKYINVDKEERLPQVEKILNYKQAATINDLSVIPDKLKGLI